MAQFAILALLAVVAPALAFDCAPGDNPNDCQGLAALFSATNGAHWKNNTNWMDATVSYCSWYGVTCEKPTNRVSALYLTANGLGGVLPEKMFMLDKLVQVYLDSNELTGPIPTTIGNAPHLQYLYLQNNHMSGGIPSEIQANTRLSDLHLSNNKFEGSLGAIGNMTWMIDLYIENNHFSGALDLGGLTHLQDLLANDNAFSSIPDSACGAIPSRTCNFARNPFRCPLPSCVPASCVASCSNQAASLRATVMA